jgi:hypothetical protein
MPNGVIGFPVISPLSRRHHDGALFDGSVAFVLMGRVH